MNRSEMQLPRIPGSAILAVVFLGILCLIYVSNFVLAIVLDTGLALLFFPFAFLSATLAGGIIGRKRWARITAIVWSAMALAALVIAILVQSHPTVNPSTTSSTSALIGANIGFQGLLLFFLAQRNTDLWCNVRGERLTRPLQLEVENSPEPGVFTFHDEVELLFDVDEAGLSAGMVGTVVDMPEDPDLVVVEFDIPEKEQTARATLKACEVRLADEAV